MTSTKLVLRVLDASGALLGAIIHQAAVKGDACLRASGPIIFRADVAGVATELSVHWPDVNIETRVPMTATVDPSVPVLLYPAGTILMRAGETPQGLPPITIRESVVAQPLTGALGAAGN